VNRRHLYRAILDPGKVGKIDEDRAFTMHHQKPAAHSLLNGMQGIATDSLLHLR
jgi:hypothetical protein